MKPSKLPVGVLMILPVVIGFGLYAFTTQAEEVEDPNAATPTATIDRLIDPADSTESDRTDESYWATQTAAAAGPTLSPDDEYATYTAGQPTPTPEITRRGDFHDGARVRVNAGAGDCLNARNTPSLANEYVIVNICVPDGHEGVIAGHAEQGDGRWSWNLAGMGWVAEEFLTYTGEFNGRDNVVAELSGVAGKVAFLRGNDVWMMRPDGSGQTLLVDHPEQNGQNYVPGPAGLTWSPDGTRISYNIDRWGDGTPNSLPGVDLHILTVDEDGLVSSQVLAGLGGGGWAADSVRLGVIRDAQPPQMGGGMTGVPAVLDVTTGGQLVLGSVSMYQQKPPSFNFDGTLLMVNESIYPTDGSAPTSGIVIYTADGAEYDRIDFSGEGIGYASPTWSPNANRIALHVSRQQGETTIAQYQIYDVATRTFAGDARPPKYSEKTGGGCGGDMWNTEWSLDGGRVLYSFMLGDTGANGIWSWDIASGAQHVIYAANAASPTAGPGSIVMFSSDSYPLSHIFYGSSEGGLPRIITDGSSTVWWVG